MLMITATLLVFLNVCFSVAGCLFLINRVKYTGWWILNEGLPLFYNRNQPQPHPKVSGGKCCQHPTFTNIKLKAATSFFPVDGLTVWQKWTATILMQTQKKKKKLCWPNELNRNCWSPEAKEQNACENLKFHVPNLNPNFTIFFVFLSCIWIKKSTHLARLSAADIPTCTQGQHKGVSCSKPQNEVTK